MEDKPQQYTFRVTGSAALKRLKPLFPSGWIEHNDSSSAADPPDFLWENAPRKETKSFRDRVKCYSHLPNGTAVLDSKWALARLCNDDDSQETFLESHCFRGLSGFKDFCQKVQFFDSSTADEITSSFEYRDLMPSPRDSPPAEHSFRSPTLSSLRHLWVIKDAGSNGAGGVWVVGPTNMDDFLDVTTTPLVQDHRYVAQRYAFPPVLYRDRKCHVRVYGLITADGKAYCHRRCFLHVANDTFSNDLRDEVHITNCCANSHNPAKFAGEILADLGGENEHVVSLQEFSSSIHQALGTFVKETRPFIQGGEANNGFEYLGLDFILSYKGDEPIAYLLEVNAPPSQDTATGLIHAENLHNEVIHDILTLWVFPKVTGCLPRPGGWKNVFSPTDEPRGELILPSKAAILNKMRWALFEKKCSKEEIRHSSIGKPLDEQDLPTQFALNARKFYPYYNEKDPGAFFENAGGSQVPIQVIERVVASLSRRHRAREGLASKEKARKTIRRQLGAPDDSYIFLDSNATSLFRSLSRLYGDLVKAGDEIIISSENHVANVTPWTNLAKEKGLSVKWLNVSPSDDNSAVRMVQSLEKILTKRTRIVALSHASNVLGKARGLGEISTLIKTRTDGNSCIVVDGVAAVPHVYADLRNLAVDWYVVSCHKGFGPHLGGLYGKREIVESISATLGEKVNVYLEHGTISYEACEGVNGLSLYYEMLTRPFTVSKAQPHFHSQTTYEATSEYSPSTLGTSQSIERAYHLIRKTEMVLAKHLFEGLDRLKSIVLINLPATYDQGVLPIAVFRHKRLEADEVVQYLLRDNIIVRAGTFLCTERFLNVIGDRKMVRVSLTHYNTIAEIERLHKSLKKLEGEGLTKALQV